MEFKVIVPVSEIGVDIEAFGAQVIRKTVFDIHAEMLEAMRGPKSGRTYKRRGGTHRASARGEAPAIDTGFLIGSISETFPSPTLGVLTVGAEYAGILEDVLHRPFVEPAIKDVLEQLQ